MFAAEPSRNHAEAMEYAARANDIDAVAERFPDLKREVERFERALRAFVTELESAT